MPDPTLGGDWVCPVSFRGAPRGVLPARVRPVYGIDALRAIVLAVGYVQREFARLARVQGRELTWLGAPDLGLPDVLGLVGVARMFRAPPRLRLAERRDAAS